MKKTYLLSCSIFIISLLGLPRKCFAQNVGVGTAAPAAKLHIKGAADVSQLIIEANSIQGNTNPLIKLRSSTGKDLMWIHSDDSTNIFIGQYAGRVNNPAGNGSTGKYNAFVGASAGYSNNSGYANTAIGSYALYANTTGYSNTAQGYSAMRFNVNGYWNTAFGANALYLNNGNENTAIGTSSLSNNTNGRGNTAVGFYALLSNTTGINNTATGFYSLYTNSSGINNTAVGTNTLYSNSTGGYNTVTGMRALLNNTSGTGNTAHGYEALSNNTTGTQNVAVGYYAGANTVVSSYNTFLGSGAGSGSVYQMGWNNTLVGANTKTNAADIYNTIALGESALTTASNQVRIGNTSTTSIGGNVGWSIVSDGRVKKNIQYNVPGLSFINKLMPITYNLDIAAEERILELPAKRDKDGNIMPVMPFEKEARTQKEQVVYSGFIAQDVEKAAKELGYNFSAVDAAKNDKDLYGLRYADFVVPLVKAVQELSKQQEELLKRVEKLESLLSIKK